MPIFAAVYDEPGYKLLPDFYVWFIAQGAEFSGWRPHRDGKRETMSLRRDGRPTRITAWIPRTDADTYKYCIYVLPRKFDPDFQAFVREDFLGQQAGNDATGGNNVNFHELRALPAKTGTIIGSDQ